MKFARQILFAAASVLAATTFAFFVSGCSGNDEHKAPDLPAYKASELSVDQKAVSNHMAQLAKFDLKFDLTTGNWDPTSYATYSKRRDRKLVIPHLKNLISAIDVVLQKYNRPHVLQGTDGSLKTQTLARENVTVFQQMRTLSKNEINALNTQRLK